MKNREMSVVLSCLGEKIEELENDIRWRDIAIDDLRIKLKKAEDEAAELRGKIEEMIARCGQEAGR